MDYTGGIIGVIASMGLGPVAPDGPPTIVGGAIALVVIFLMLAVFNEMLSQNRKLRVLSLCGVLVTGITAAALTYWG